jgi:hypothetical protein
MTWAADRTDPEPAAWSAPGLGYPVGSVVVGAARDQDGRDTTGRDEDGTAR